MDRVHKVSVSIRLLRDTRKSTCPRTGTNLASGTPGTPWTPVFWLRKKFAHLNPEGPGQADELV